MENSFTNKNNNPSNYNNLMNFNGFYTNIYKDPFTNGFAFIFVTKPLLFIDPVKPSSSKQASKKMAYINMTRDPEFAQFLDAEKMNDLDARLVRMLSYNLDYRTSNFLPIFTNEFRSFDSNDVVMEQTDVFDTKQGYRMPMPTYKTQSEGAGQLNISVSEDANLDFTKMMMLWVNYISNITDGVFDANPEMITNGTLDYTSSIYYFVLEPDGQTLKYWAKYTGCWPTTIPYGMFKYAKKTNEIVDLDLPFVYTVKEDMNPKILEDFNRVSLKIDYGKIESDNTGGYYTPIQESPLLNQEIMMRDAKVSESIKLAMADPDRDPLVFFKKADFDGTNTDQRQARFILSFGDNAYKSKVLDEVFDKDSNEKSATGWWEED